MTGRRGWYVAGLVAAVLALVLSVGAAVMVTHRSTWWGPSAASAEGWRQGQYGPMGRGGGMMGYWDDDEATVTQDQARASAQEWLDAHEPGSTLGQPVSMPMGYLFTVTRDGQVIGTIMVDDDTGQLVWRTVAQPSPTSSAS